MNQISIFSRTNVCHLYMVAIMAMAGCELESGSSTRLKTDQNATIRSEQSAQSAGEPSSALRNITLTDNPQGVDNRAQNKTEAEVRHRNQWKKEDILLASKKYLEKSGFPHQERVGVITKGNLSGENVYVATFSNPDSNARSGEWILYFDPSKTLDENPVKADLHR